MEVKTYIYKEELIYKYVSYPGLTYGAFLAFSKNKHDWYFCECAKNGLKNYLEFRVREKPYNNAMPERDWLFDAFDCSKEGSAKAFAKRRLTRDANLFKYLEFQRDICHLCEGRIPEKAFCHPMYGPPFTQQFGYYLEQNLYANGLKHSGVPIKRLLNRKYFDALGFCIDEYCKRYENLLLKKANSNHNGTTKQFAKKHDKELMSIEASLVKMSKQQVRDKAAFKTKWITEEKIYSLVKSIFPTLVVLKNVRLEELDRLEIDVYVPELKAGIEYNGRQHYEPVDFFGGEEAFKKRIENDKKKKRLANKVGIKIHTIKYTRQFEIDRKFIKALFARNK